MKVIELRATAAPYVIFGGIFGATFVLGIVVTLLREPSFWAPTLIMGVLTAIFLVWLASAKLTLTETALRYRSLFKQIDMRLQDITDAEHEIGFTGDYRPYQRVILLVVDQEKQVPRQIILNVSLFNQRKTRALVKTLKEALRIEGKKA